MWYVVVKNEKNACGRWDRETLAVNSSHDPKGK
jgi:hypothetical protein